MSEPASKLDLLIAQLTLEPNDGEKYNQTAVLPISAYYQLCGLSDYLHIPRSRLSGMLLAAAITDGINKLPNVGQISDAGHDFATPQEYVHYLAWQAKNTDETAERHLNFLRANGAKEIPEIGTTSGE